MLIRFSMKKEVIDYIETFPPILKMINKRTLMVVAVEEEWGLFRLDRINVFLHGDLHKTIYGKLPRGLTTVVSNVLCRL